MKVKKRITSRKRKIRYVLLIIPIFSFYIFVFQPFFGCVSPNKNNIEYFEGDRIKEYLDRGLVAMYINNTHVYIGWRLLEDDPTDVSFNIYRDTEESTSTKLNVNPINLTTDFIDQPPLNETNIRYWIRPIINSTELAISKETEILNNVGEQFISIDLNGNYTFQKVGIADLDGDGNFDFVIKEPNYNIDPYSPPLGHWKPSTDTYKIEAYLSNGTFLWCKDLGWDIEQGIWYSPYIVYDFNGDNKAEVVIKTGTGDHRDIFGRVQTGPEYLSIWNGMSGSEINRVNWPSRMPEIYNFNSRNQLGIAYLDGCHPSILAARGTYGIMQLETYNLTGNHLVNLWKWNSRQECFFKYYGQGAHYMHSADVDSDGYDEVILGSCVINENGRGLWSTGLSHPDHCYVGDIDPGHPGLEIYYGIEGVIHHIPKYDNGICLVDAATGNVLWGIKENTYHIHSQGLVSDIDPSKPGMECYSGEDNYPKRWLHSANGTLIENEEPIDIGLNPKAVYWDADLQRELIHEGRIFDYETKYTHFSGVQGYQVAWADILGDWREEIIVSLEGELRIYTTTIPAQDRRVCLMQDPIYRLDVAHLSMGYAQVPTTSYCLDDTVIKPSIYVESGDNFYNFIMISVLIAVIILSIISVIMITYWLVLKKRSIIDKLSTILVENKPSEK
ncbi:MAG: silent information regulator protein Sir2 [Candidatus Hodarchaeota archaeon]